MLGFLQSHEDREKTEIDKDHMLALDSLHTEEEKRRRKEEYVLTQQVVQKGQKDRKNVKSGN